MDIGGGCRYFWMCKINMLHICVPYSEIFNADRMNPPHQSHGWNRH